MNADEANAKGAERAGLVVAIAVSSIPVLGGPASVVAQYIGNIPGQRRVQRILDALQADLARAFEQLDETTLQVLESEEFNAAIFRVLRESMETADESKRESLRNALINGYVMGTFDERDRFLALVGTYGPLHAQVLGALASIMSTRDHLLDNAVSHISRHLGDSHEHSNIRAALQDLVADGLAAESSAGEVREQVRRTNEWQRPKTEQIIVQTRYHTITARGREFLQFVRSPSGEGAAT